MAPWKVFNLPGGAAEFSSRLKSKFDVSSIEECIALGKKYLIKQALR